MATDSPTLRTAGRRSSREIPHTVSPGLWTLAWRRLRPTASAWCRSRSSPRSS